MGIQRGYNQDTVGYSGDTLGALSGIRDTATANLTKTLFHRVTKDWLLFALPMF